MLCAKHRLKSDEHEPNYGWHYHLVVSWFSDKSGWGHVHDYGEHAHVECRLYLWCWACQQLGWHSGIVGVQNVVS